MSDELKLGELNNLSKQELLDRGFVEWENPYVKIGSKVVLRKPVASNLKTDPKTLESELVLPLAVKPSK